MARWAVLAVVLVGCVACEEKSAAPDPSRARPYRELVQRLAAAGKQAPASNEASCAGKLAALDGGEATVLMADARWLVALGAGRLPATGPWDWLTSPALRRLPAQPRFETEKELVDALYQAKRLDAGYTYLGVVHASARDQPRLEGRKFYGGRLEGWLVVHALGSGRRLCQARFAAESSQQVAGEVGTTQVRALQRDLKVKAREALDDAMARLSPQLHARFE